MTEEIWDDCIHATIPVEMLDFHNHPTPSQLEKRLGKELTEVFLKSCKPIEAVLFGRDKPLKGPDDKKMWISPTDRYNASNNVRVCATEMSSRTECLQALTHHGILSIGKEIEEQISRKHEEVVALTVKEVEELERFESEKRIEFHVGEATRKLNEEWQRRYDALVNKHKEEKECERKIFQDDQKNLREFLEKKYREEIDNCVKKAIAETKREMEELCARTVDDELAQQQITFQEAMKVTLANIKANDRDKMDELRNQCLRAMDVQCQLMMCRQIAELIHTMSVEKQHWQKKFNTLRKEYETKIIDLEMRLNSLTGELSREYQSKSIIVALWRKFFKSLGVIDTSKLTQEEKRLFYEFHQFQCDLSENFDDKSSRVITFEENEQQQNDEESLDDRVDDDDMNWIKNVDECIRRGNSVKDSSVAVNWELQSPMEINDPIEDEFMSSIFQRASRVDVDNSMISEIVSSIIALARESTDDKQLSEILFEMLRNTFNKREHITIDDMVSLPKVDALNIRDSKEIIEKKISIATDETVKHPSKLLAAVDSLEVLSRRTSKDVDVESNLDENIVQIYTAPVSYSDEIDYSIQTAPSSHHSYRKCLPSYMNIPEYKKMTLEEWNQLEMIEKTQSMLKSQRMSSITFDETPSIDRNTSQSSARHSILKNQHSAIIPQRNELDKQQNALFPIHEKCRETMRNMKVKSVLKLLCNDEDIDTNFNDNESNATLSSAGAQVN